MKIDKNQSFYESKVNRNNNKYKQTNNSGLKFRKALTTDTVSFSGMRTVIDSTGHLVNKFYLPKHLKADTIQLVTQKVKKALGVGEYTNMSHYELDGNAETHKSDETSRWTIPTAREDRAYYFQMQNGERIIDSGRIGNLFKENWQQLREKAKMFNILSDFGDVTVNKAGNMLLIFPDSVVDPQSPHKTRNCVNHLGGKLQNITKMMSGFQAAGYRRLVLTPTTSDPMSSHKYWAVNLYQTDKALGSEKDYDDMVSTANMNGINIVSDAAFGKTGIASFQFQDVLLRGKASPYWNYYNVNNLDNGLIDIGVLPEDTEHVKFKFVNNPNNSDYDPKKDTYVQIYDDRLVSDEETKSNKLIMGYQNDNVKKEEQNDLIGAGRAVIPYYFPVNPNELTGGQDKKFNIDNLEFENYRITKSKYVGFEQWDGMQDLVKEKFFMDNFDNLDFNLTQGDCEARQKGCWQVQDAEILSSGHATKRVACVIGEDTAVALHKMGLSVNKSPKDILTTIKADNSSLKSLVETAPNEVDEESIKEVLNGNYKLKDVDVFSNAKDYITKELMSVPFETLDVAQSLMAILSSSAISKRASVECEVGKSRFEVMKGYNDGDHDVEPYQNIDSKDLKSYMATDEMFTQILVPFAQDVLKSIETDDKKIFDGDDLTILGRYAVRYMAPDIFRFAMYKALNPEIKPTVDKASGRLYFNLTDEQREGLSLRSLNSFNRENPEYDALNVINSIKSGLENITDGDKKELTEALKARFEKYDETSLKLSSMLIDKAETGLDWRLDAAKDVSNINLLRTHQETYANVMDNVTKFWNKFGKAVHSQNTHSYIVGEFTDMGDFVDKNDKSSKYPTDFIAEEEIRKNSKMTSSANYSYLWSLQEMFCRESAYGYLNGNSSNPTEWLMTRFITQSDWVSNPGYANSDDIRNINQSYTFTENHDKPRILSAMALDLGLFNSKFDNDEDRKKAAKVLNGDFKSETFTNFDFTKLSAKSIAMGYRLNEALDSLKEDSDLEQPLISGLRKAIGELAKSEVPQSNEAFGVKPFNEAIKDVLEKAESTKGKTEEEKSNIVDKILQQIIKPAASKYLRLYKMLLTLPGCPTDFLGTSMGLTGWEALCKNPYQQCRGAIPDKDKLPKWLKDCLLTPVKNLQQMKQQPELNPLVDGDTHALPFATDRYSVNIAKTKDGKDVNLAPILRYNQDGDVIINVYSFDGINVDDHLNLVQNKNLELEELVIYDPGKAYDPRFSPFQFNTDAKFKLQGDDENVYVVEYKNDGKCVIKKKGGGNITLNQNDMNTSIFYMI